MISRFLPQTTRNNDTPCQRQHRFLIFIGRLRWKLKLRMHDSYLRWHLVVRKGTLSKIRWIWESFSGADKRFEWWLFSVWNFCALFNKKYLGKLVLKVRTTIQICRDLPKISPTVAVEKSDRWVFFSVRTMTKSFVLWTSPHSQIDRNFVHADHLE